MYLQKPADDDIDRSKHVFFFFLSSTALGGLWLSSQLAASYFVPALSLSIHQFSFILDHQIETCRGMEII
jgi:hypothetical protein